MVGMAELGDTTACLPRAAVRRQNVRRSSIFAASALCSRLASPPRPARAQIGSDRYSSIVIDAASGNVLSAVNADELRHPASLTKMMTLYMVFEALRDRRITLDQLRAGVQPCRRHEPVQARPAARHAHHRRAGDPRPGHQIGQRRRRRARRTARRRRGPVRPDDDPARPRARHEPHACSATPPACPTRNRSPPRATWPPWAASWCATSRPNTAGSRFPLSPGTADHPQP